MVLIADDAQWMDSALIRALIAATEGEAMFVVVAGRTGWSRHIDFSLGALSDTVVADLIGSMAGPLPKAAIDELVNRSEGSPFLAVEGLRGWVEGGVVQFTAQGWIRSNMTNVHASALAGTLLSQRLDILDSEEIELLSSIALLDRGVKAQAVAEWLGRPLDSVIEVMERARNQRLLWSADGKHYEFCHDRLREALEARLSEPRRRELHYQAALWWSQAVDQDQRLAHHYHLAGRGDLALDPALRAAGFARRSGALKSAERFLRIAVECGGGGITLRELAEVLVEQGKVSEEARDLLRRAALECGSGEERARVESAKARLEYRCDRPEQALKHLREALLTLHQLWPSRRMLAMATARELLLHFTRLVGPPAATKPISDRRRYDLVIELYKKAAETAFELSRVDFCIFSHFHLLNSADRYQATPQLGNLYSYHLALAAGQFGRFGFPTRRWRAGLTALARHGSSLQKGKAGVWMAMRHLLAARLHQAERTARRP